jgi:aryl sulfotransferase
MALPQKTREMHNHHFDSNRWDDFKFRPDDIIVATAYKSGTTWMQNLVFKLIYQGRQFPSDPGNLSPWLDLRVPPLEVLMPLLEGTEERRQIKTHLRLDAIPFNKDAKYIYVGRDGRDCYMSLVNHYRQGNELWYQVLNGPGLVGDPLPVFDEQLHSETKLFDDWISKGWPTLGDETDGYPFWSLFDNVRTWWEYRNLPNVHFVHFNDLLTDLPGAVRDIANFLGISIDEAGFPALVETLTFQHMKAECSDPHKTIVPMAGAVWKDGPAGFINKVLISLLEGLDC